MNTGMKRAVIVMSAAALLAVSPLVAQPAGRTRSAAPPAAASQPRFSPNQVEAYATASDLAFIRPGLKIIVNSVTIGSDRKPVVDISLTDSLDQPLDRLGKVTPGAISVSFILSWYSPATRQYTAYTTRSVTTPANSPHPNVTAIQAGTDTGAFTDLETGHAKFIFKTVLPSGFDQTKTHTLGIYATRALGAVPGIDPALAKNYYANVEYDFRPDGVAVTDKWDKINLATSCNNCHDPLSAHGGARQDPKLCALCHQPQTIDPDTGNTVDFKVLIHKIHDGANLPSVKAGTPYQIIGFGQAVNDFSTVKFPIGNEVTNCAFCHEGTNPAAKPAQASVWYSNPTRAACGSCHDDIDWVTGKNHVAGPQADDSACSSCHTPDSGQEFDASIKAAHTVPLKSKQLKGLTSTVVSVTNAAPGKSPTVVYAIKNGDGTPVDGTKLTTFAPILAGPTSNYSTFFRESAIATVAKPATYNATTGLTTYTFIGVIPANSTGTWTVSADTARNTTLKHFNGTADTTQREFAVNPIKYFAVTGTAVTPRRTVVAVAQCNSCHDVLGLHGGQRMVTEECVICHNPTNSDISKRAAGDPAESISFQHFIHRIHTGDNLTNDFTVSGTNFNDVRFPGDTRNCAKCHVGTSYTLPLPSGIASVTTPRDFFTIQGPATAACLGCHDSKDTAAHAYLNSVTFPGATVPSEACATCHSTGKDWAVEKVHAR
ncbi:MAG TPA: OmcA/MtrC family decaheme c-type cytochrome [Thermoanaerobaculia bacterium]|nr:OmcA/MtrC family decaheme c-type cytochrome [Thermoanaerobaculia bacterium]